MTLNPFRHTTLSGHGTGFVVSKPGREVNRVATHRISPLLPFKYSSNHFGRGFV